LYLLTLNVIMVITLQIQNGKSTTKHYHKPLVNGTLEGELWATGKNCEWPCNNHVQLLIVLFDMRRFNHYQIFIFFIKLIRPIKSISVLKEWCVHYLKHSVLLVSFVFLFLVKNSTTIIFKIPNIVVPNNVYI